MYHDNIIISQLRNNTLIIKYSNFQLLFVYCDELINDVMRGSSLNYYSPAKSGPELRSACDAEQYKIIRL